MKKKNQNGTMKPMKGQNKYTQEAGLKRGKIRSKLLTCD